jgi:hypothetical protein
MAIPDEWRQDAQDIGRHRRAGSDKAVSGA